MYCKYCHFFLSLFPFCSSFTTLISSSFPSSLSFPSIFFIFMIHFVKITCDLSTVFFDLMSSQWHFNNSHAFQWNNDISFFQFCHQFYVWLTLIVLDGGGGGQNTPCDAKFSEKCSCSHNINTALIKQISLVDTAWYILKVLIKKNTIK